MRISFLLIITLLISCQSQEQEETLIEVSEPVPCIQRKSFEFEKFTSRIDSTFILFRNPIDSLNGLIELENIEPLRLPYMSDTSGHKHIWYHNGNIIKIENHIVFYERPIYHRYYVQDQCYWFYEREEYHEDDNDSLIHCDLYYYKDSTILNAFVGASMYECAFMIVADSNRYSLDKARQARDRFISELEWFSR